MSKRRIVLIGVAMLATALPVGGQTVAELRAQSTALQARRAESYDRLLRAESAARSTPDDSLVVHGAVVRFRRAHLSDSDQRAVARAFDAAASELSDAFGDAGPALLAGDQWLLSVNEQRNTVAFELMSPSTRLGANLPLPLRGTAVQRLVSTRASSAVASRSAVIRTWLGGVFSLEEAERTHYFAYRQLVLHARPEGQRCARGVARDCATFLGVGISQSVLRYAVERDGAAVLQMLQRAPDPSKSAVELIANALGQTDAEFLAAWHARIVNSGATRASGSPGLLLTSLGWCVLFAAAASRRRPR